MSVQKVVQQSSGMLASLLSVITARPHAPRAGLAKRLHSLAELFWLVQFVHQERKMIRHGLRWLFSCLFVSTLLLLVAVGGLAWWLSFYLN